MASQDRNFPVMRRVQQRDEPWEQLRSHSTDWNCSSKFCWEYPPEFARLRGILQRKESRDKSVHSDGRSMGYCPIPPKPLQPCSEGKHSPGWSAQPGLPSISLTFARRIVIGPLISAAAVPSSNCTGRTGRLLSGHRRWRGVEAADGVVENARGIAEVVAAALLARVD